MEVEVRVSVRRRVWCQNLPQKLRIEVMSVREPKRGGQFCARRGH